MGPTLDMGHITATNRTRCNPLSHVPVGPVNTQPWLILIKTFMSGWATGQEHCTPKARRKIDGRDPTGQN